MKRGSVRLLVVLYSINVFLTFSLSLFGLCRHWWERRLYQLDWKAKFAVAAIGFIVCAAILIVILAEKLMLGGWVTVLITSAVVGFCLIIHRHYEQVRSLMLRVDQRSEEHTSELQSLMRISYAVFCLKKKQK